MSLERDKKADSILVNRQRIRIAHFNTFTEGGAAVLMLRLHQSLLDSGMESHVYYRKGDLFARNTYQLEFAPARHQRLRERVKLRLENWLLRMPGNLFTTLTAPRGTRLETQPRADIYHLHWISHWLDLPSFVATAGINQTIGEVAYG